MLYTSLLTDAYMHNYINNCHIYIIIKGRRYTYIIAACNIYTIGYISCSADALIKINCMIQACKLYRCEI